MIKKEQTLRGYTKNLKLFSAVSEFEGPHNFGNSNMINQFFMEMIYIYRDYLNKMIEFEGFSEILKDQTIPLDWFGLYLQSNIENIPYNHKRQNFSYLYQELLDESLQKLKENSDEKVIYHMVKKIKVAENFTKGLENSYYKMKRIKLDFDLYPIIKNMQVDL